MLSPQYGLADIAGAMPLTTLYLPRQSSLPRHTASSPPQYEFHFACLFIDGASWLMAMIIMRRSAATPYRRVRGRPIRLASFYRLLIPALRALLTTLDERCCRRQRYFAPA